MDIPAPFRATGTEVSLEGKWAGGGRAGLPWGCRVRVEVLWGHGGRAWAADPLQGSESRTRFLYTPPHVPSVSQPRCSPTVSLCWTFLELSKGLELYSAMEKGARRKDPLQGPLQHSKGSAELGHPTNTRQGFATTGSSSSQDKESLSRCWWIPGCPRGLQKSLGGPKGCAGLGPGGSGSESVSGELWSSVLEPGLRIPTESARAIPGLLSPTLQAGQGGVRNSSPAALPSCTPNWARLGGVGRV